MKNENKLWLEKLFESASKHFVQRSLGGDPKLQKIEDWEVEKLKEGHDIVIMARQVVPPWRDAPCPVRTVSKPWEQEDLVSFDLVIATDRTHVLALTERAARLVYMVQSDDEGYAQTDEEKAIARQALNLPIPKIAISPELARRMARRFPGR